MIGEVILAILILIVLFHSELKARRWAEAFEKEHERQYQEGIAFYERLKEESGIGEKNER